MSENEVWRDVLGFEGIYQVSNKGNIFSVDRIVRGKKWGGRTLKPRPHRNGYLQVELYKNSIRKKKYIHRLVAEAFLPNPNGFPEINHKDEIKTNNCVENLEWCTRKYNNNYGTKIERLSKKVSAVDIETGEVLTFNSIREAGRKGYTRKCVSLACRGVYKNSNGKLIGDGHTYRGYRWSYIEEGD